MTVDPMPRVTPDWLSLREPADAAARSAELAGLLHLDDPAVIWDLGSGTGAMGRWLSPLLPVEQRWVLCDRDLDLLEVAALDTASVQTRQCDVSKLTAEDLDGAGLVTCSALLDLLTEAEVDRIAAACLGARCPALLTLSVVGRVELTPAHPLDPHVEAAFNEHQRRLAGGRRLLGPDATEAAVQAFTRRGAATVVRPSPWRLGSGALVAQWLAGWVSAACEQRPDLAPLAEPYAAQRLAQAAQGLLSAVVHHSDMLASWE